LSSLYLIRHGQAGLRQNYDTLSDIGRTQARLLGEYLAAQKTGLSAIYSGALERQRETAAGILSALTRSGAAAPVLQIDARWNEFDLDAVYQAIAPRLAADALEFRAEYEKLMLSMHDENSPVHHTWTRCDKLVVRALVEERYEVPCESWRAFRERVCGPIQELSRIPSSETVAVVSSATPIAVWIGEALGLNGRHVMRLAGVTYNAALTTMRIRESDLALFTFNGTPHLPEPHVRTFR